MPFVRWWSCAVNFKVFGALDWPIIRREFRGAPGDGRRRSRFFHFLSISRCQERKIYIKGNYEERRGDKQASRVHRPPYYNAPMKALGY
jgi:hypothetical protein